MPFIEGNHSAFCHLFFLYIILTSVRLFLSEDVFWNKRVNDVAWLWLVGFPLLLYLHLYTQNKSTCLCPISISYFYLQALAEEMDAQNERLGWLNKHAPQILASPSVSPQSRDHHVGKLRVINLNWSKVPTRLPSSYLPHFTRTATTSPALPACLLFLLHLSFTYSFLSFSSAGDPWVVGQSRGGWGRPAKSRPFPGQDESTYWLGRRHTPNDRDQRPEPCPGAGRLSKYITRTKTLNLTENPFITNTNVLPKVSSYLWQALEASMKDRKKDLEDLLAHSIELQRRQQLLPQEKVPVSIIILLWLNKVILQVRSCYFPGV